MENKPFNGVPSWIKEVRDGHCSCPICKSSCLTLTEIKTIATDPLNSEWRILCQNCGTIFDETKWNESILKMSSREREKILDALDDKVPVNDLEAQSVNKPNLIILRTNMLLESSSFEWLLQYIHTNIKNGILLLPGYVDFVGAYEVDDDFKSKVIIQNWPNENPSIIN